MIDSTKLQAWVFEQMRTALDQKQIAPDYWRGYEDALSKLLEHLDKEHDIPANDNWLIY